MIIHHAGASLRRWQCAWELVQETPMPLLVLSPTKN